MAKLNINIGSSANDKTGDPLRTAFSKVNANFTELYALTGSAESVQELVQDYAVPLLTHAGHSGISFVYDDVLNKIVATVSVIPTQLGNSGRYLSTNGATASWETIATDTISNISATVKLQASLSRLIASSGIRYELFNGSKFGEDNTSTTALSSMTGGKLILRTTNSLNTVRDWEFSDAGNFKLPAGGNIYTSDSIAYNSWDNISGKPTIPAAQVQSDWNASSGLGQILNKPTIPTSFSSLVNGSYTLSLGSTGNTTFPTGLVLGAPRGPNTVNFTTAIDKSFQIETGTSTTSKLWSFGTDGTTTFPTNISINYSGGNVLFPRIIADSGKAFSVQGQGSTGSAALSWTVDPDAAGQYAAVAVSRAGDNLAKVILQAQSNSGDGATVKLWKFDETGALTLPKGSVIGNTTEIVTVTLDQFTDGGFAGTRVFTKVSDTLYELSPGGPYMTLISGIWRLKVSTATYYDSTDLITWGTVAGGLPAPVGTLGTQATVSLTANGNTWAFVGNGNLKFPGAVINSTVAKTGGGVGTETALDLTKSVNKLTNGLYTLANGVEGQIMYLVRQTGSTAHTVTVANARIAGLMETALPFSPFTDGTDPTNMATLIFTDGAWQNMGGFWNLT